MPGALPRRKRNTDMSTYHRLATALLVSTLLALGSFGCNTFRGMGRDIQKGGEGVENAADDVQYGEQR
jgi:predicted small secreted protein